MKSIYPAENRVVVLPDPAEEKSEGGIYLTDQTKDSQRATRTGKVIAVGVRRIEATGQRFDSQFKPGMKVVWGRYSGQEIKLDGETHVILREDDVAAQLPT